MSPGAHAERITDVVFLGSQPRSRHDSATCQPHLAAVESVKKQEGKSLGSVDYDAEYVWSHTPHQLRG